MSLAARNALIALFITLVLTGTVVYAVNYLNNVRLVELTALEDQLAINALSLETQFSLLEAAPCESAASSTILSSELGDLGARLAYTENQLGSDNEQVTRLKQKYTLLEIRDYLVARKLATACGTKVVTVLYFYSNDSDCEDCDKAGYALSYLRDTYPTLRVYSFDYGLDLGALRTLVAVHKVQGDVLPAFVINGKYSSGFTDVDEFITRFPKGALSTSTPKTTTR